MTGLVVDDPLAFGGVFRVPGRQRHLSPVDAVDLGLGRVPRVMRVRKAHPAEPVLVGAQRIEPADRPIGHPVGVVQVAVDRVHLHLGSIGVPAASAVYLHRRIEDAVEAADHLGVLPGQPLRIVQGSEASVAGQLQVFETPV